MERTSRTVWFMADSIQPLSEVAGYGCFEAIFQALSIDADFENISIDSTSCKVHQGANSGEKSGNKAVGVSRGGRNTKIHTLVDGLGNPHGHRLPGGRPVLPDDCVAIDAMMSSQGS